GFSRGHAVALPRYPRNDDQQALRRGLYGCGGGGDQRAHSGGWHAPALCQAVPLSRSIGLSEVDQGGIHAAREGGQVSGRIGAVTHRVSANSGNWLQGIDKARRDEKMNKAMGLGISEAWGIRCRPSFPLRPKIIHS